MKITPEMHADYEKIKERGDLPKLMKRTKINDKTHMCAVMARKRDTSVSRVVIIFKWIEKKKKRLEPINITETDNN